MYFKKIIFSPDSTQLYTYTLLTYLLTHQTLEILSDLKRFLLLCILFIVYYLLDCTAQITLFGCNDGRAARAVPASSPNENSWFPSDENDRCQNFQSFAHPIFLIVSLILVFFTLLVYIWEDSLKQVIYHTRNFHLHKIKNHITGRA